MDYSTRILTGLTDENLFFDTNWLEVRQENNLPILVIKGQLYRRKTQRFSLNLLKNLISAYQKSFVRN